MNTIYNKKLQKNAQTLRNNMTQEEKHLWYDFLKTLPKTINRQKIIGKYIVDFYCASAKIVIELDGAQHYDTNGKKSDYERDLYLKTHGITVLRYSNTDIHKCFDAVCLDILHHLDTSSVTQASHLPLKGKA